MATAQGIGPFLWGAGGEKLSPEDAKARRATADRLRKPEGYTPEGWRSLLGSLAGEGVGQMKENEAVAAEKAGHAGVADALAKAQETGDYMGVLSDEWVTPQQSAVAGALQGRGWQKEDQAAQWGREDARYAQQRSDAAAAASRPKFEMFAAGGDQYRYNANDPNSKPELFFDGPEAAPKTTVVNGQLVNDGTGEVVGDYRDAPPPPGAPTIEESFDPATGRPVKRQWVNGAWQDFGGVAAPKDPLVTVNTGDTDSALDKTLSGKEGESWAAYKDAAAVAGSNAQDFAVLDELLTVAPQGPITGRLAETFQGFSSAGDAVKAIVKRIAPTLRVPGSGATSDIEYAGMLQSLAQLPNSPEANTMIMSIMKAKQDVNIRRGDIVTAYQNGDFTVEEARRQMAELNRMSIVTPEMKEALLGVGASGNVGTTSSGLNWSVEQ